MIAFLIFVFIFLIFLSFYTPKDYSLRYFIFVFLGLCLSFAAGIREGWSDYQNYVNGYHYAVAGDIGALEVSFFLISRFVDFIFGNILGLFIIYGAIGVFLKLISIKQLTELWFLSLIIYVSNFYILHELIQMRAGVASGFLLLCIKPIYDRNWKLFLTFFLCAFFFHYSSLVILPLWFLTNKPRKIFLYLSVPVAYFIYFTKINLVSVAIPIPAIQAKINLYQEMLAMGEQNQINVFNYVFLVKIMIFYILLWKIDLLQKKNQYATLLIKIFALSIFAFPVFATMPVIGFRISELFGIVEIILFPLLYYIAKPKVIPISVVISIGLLLFYISVFYGELLVNN